MKIRLLSFFILFVPIFCQAQQAEVFATEAGAIKGYDPVAFFKENKAVQGTSEFVYSWNGADWHFSSQENLDLFKATPEQYAPQYGGFCAFGVASGHKSPSQPETWAIVDNKLYLTFNPNVQKLWNKNRKGLIDQADKRWPTVKTTAPHEVIK